MCLYWDAATHSGNEFVSLEALGLYTLLSNVWKNAWLLNWSHCVGACFPKRNKFVTCWITGGTTYVVCACRSACGNLCNITVQYFSVLLQVFILKYFSFEALFNSPAMVNPRMDGKMGVWSLYLCGCWCVFKQDTEHWFTPDESRDQQGPAVIKEFTQD